jgi:signal transduction histidine kinase/DNA-binding NarL/FixJ family response regulator
MSHATLDATRVRPQRVVLIDDTFDLRELLRLALTRGGMEIVGEAGDGLAGIEAVRTERPDIVLLDLSMPVMDGLEALPSIRRLVPDATIIVLSAFGATHMSERALATGADGYLQKGMPLKRILEHVRAIASGARETPSAQVAPGSAAQAAPAAPARHAAEPGLEPDVSTWDALALAPYGVLEIADEPLFRVIHANPTAQRLLENAARHGVPLGTVAPLLNNLVAYHRLDGEASFVADVNGVGVHATLRRTDRSLLVFLDSSVEDHGVLRRAIATTAHEIRGPVAVLCGIAESIAEEGDTMSGAQRTRLMASVTRQARVLDSITADLLTAAELQRGSLRLAPQRVQPADVLRAVVDDRYLVHVDTVVRDERAVLADPLRLEQMLGNLLANALKYGRAPFVVSVRAHRTQPDLVSVEVSDCGDGVPAEFQDQLFREYTRAGGSVATGTGLGLYVVRSLAEAQGGEATYTPGPDGGACFAISLPALDAD